jgi:hypothetical protein
MNQDDYAATGPGLVAGRQNSSTATNKAPMMVPKTLAIVMPAY